MAGRLSPIYDDLLKQLNAMSGGKYTIRQDSQFHDRITIQDTTSKKSITMNLTNAAADVGRVWLVGSDSGDQQKVVSPRITANRRTTVGMDYESDIAQIKYSATSSTGMLSGMIYQAFNRAGRTGDPMRQFNRFLSEGDETLGYRPAPSIPRGHPSTQIGAINQIDFRALSDGKRANPDEYQEIIGDFRAQQANAYTPNFPIKQIENDQSTDARPLSMQYLYRGRYIPNEHGRMEPIWGTNVNEVQVHGQWGLNTKPKTIAKSNKLSSGSDPATPFRVVEGHAVPLIARPTTNTNRPSYAISNLVMPGEAQGRKYERQTTVFDNFPVPGAAIAYHDPNAVKADFWGVGNVRHAKVASLNLAKLLSGEQKMEFTNYASKTHGQGKASSVFGYLQTGDAKPEPIRVRFGPGAWRGQGSRSLSLPSFVNPVSGEFSADEKEGYVPTSGFDEQLKEKLGGMILKYERVANPTLNFAGANESSTSMKGMQIKASEMFTGLDQEVNGQRVTRFTGELKGSSFLYGYFGGLSYNQMQGLAKDWNRRDKSGLGAKVGQYLKENYADTARAGRELNIDFNQMATDLGYEGVGGGLGLLNDWFSGTIRAPRRGSSANRRNIEKYGAGYASGWMQLGVVHGDQLEHLRENWRLAHDGMSPEESDALFKKTFRMKKHGTDEQGRPLYLGSQRLSEGAMMINMLTARRVENVHGPRMTQQWMQAVSQKYPEFAKQLGADVDTFKPQGKTQSSAVGILKYALWQGARRDYNKGISDDDGGMPSNYREISDETLSSISAHLASISSETSSPIEQLKSVVDKYFPEDKSSGADTLFYNRTTDQLIANPRAIYNSTFSELGVEAAGLAKPTVGLLSELGGIVDDVEATPAMKVNRALSAASPLQDQVERLITGSGNFFKRMLGTNIRSAVSGRTGGALNLAHDEVHMDFNMAMMTAKQMGFSGQDAIAKAKEIMRSRASYVSARQPMGTDTVESRNLVDEDVYARERFASQEAYERVARNPLARGQIDVPTSWATSEIGDFDRDPISGALGLQRIGNELKTIENSQVRADVMTAEKIRAIEENIFPNEGMRKMVNANVKQLKDYAEGKQVVGSALSQKKNYSPQEVLATAWDRLMNKTLGMGVGYNPRRAIGGAMVAGGYNAKEIANVMSSMPGLYQPALDTALVGREATGVRAASIIARPYFHLGPEKVGEDGKPLERDRLLRVAMTGMKERGNVRMPIFDKEGNEVGIRLLPKEASPKMDVDIDKLFGGKGPKELLNFGRFVAEGFASGYNLDGQQVGMSPMQYAGFFAAPGDLDMLTQKIETADSGQWGDIVTGYQRGLYMQGRERGMSHIAATEQVLSTPAMMGILTRAGSKAINKRNPLLGTEQIEGAHGVFNLIADNASEGFLNQWTTAIASHDVEHRAKGLNLRALHPSNLRTAAETMGGHVKGIAMRTLARIMDVRYGGASRAAKESPIDRGAREDAEELDRLLGPDPSKATPEQMQKMLDRAAAQVRAGNTGKLSVSPDDEAALNSLMESVEMGEQNPDVGTTPRAQTEAKYTQLTGQEPPKEISDRQLKAKTVSLQARDKKNPAALNRAALVRQWKSLGASATDEEISRLSDDDIRAEINDMQSRVGGGREAATKKPVVDRNAAGNAVADMVENRRNQASSFPIPERNAPTEGDATPPAQAAGGGGDGGNRPPPSRFRMDDDDPDEEPGKKHVPPSAQDEYRDKSNNVARKVGHFVLGTHARVMEYQENAPSAVDYMDDLLDQMGFKRGWKTGKDGKPIRKAGDVLDRTQAAFKKDKAALLARIEKPMYDQIMGLRKMQSDSALALWQAGAAPGLGLRGSQIQKDMSIAAEPGQKFGDDVFAFASFGTMVGGEGAKNRFALQDAAALGSDPAFQALYQDLRPIMQGSGSMKQRVKDVRKVLSTHPEGIDMMQAAMGIGAEKSANIPDSVTEVASFAKAYKKHDPEALKRGESVTGIAADEINKVTDAYKKQVDTAKELQKATGDLNDKEKTRLEFEAKKAKAASDENVYGLLADKAQRRVDRVLGRIQDTGYATETDLKKLRSATSDVDRFMTKRNQATETSQAIADEESTGRYGMMARRMLGGFGLMYFRSIGNFATQGMGYGTEQRLAYNQIQSGAIYGATGERNIQLNQDQMLMNKMALAGSNYNAISGARQILADNPFMRDAYNASSAFVGAWGLSQFAASQIPGATGQRLSANAGKIGFAAAGLSVLSDAYARSRDTVSLGQRLESGGFIPAPTDMAAYVMAHLQGNQGDVERSRASTALSMAAGERGLTFEQMMNTEVSFGPMGKKTTGLAKDIFTKGEMFASDMNWLMQQEGFNNLSPDAAATAKTFQQRNNIALSDKRLLSIAEDAQFGGWAAQTSMQALTGLGYSQADMFSRKKGTEFDRLSGLQMRLAEGTYDEQTKALMTTGIQSLAQIKGASYIEGVGKNSQSAVTDEKIDRFIQVLGKIADSKAGDTFVAEQNASYAARRAGIEYTAPNISNFVDAQGNPIKMTEAEAVKRQTLASSVEASANTRIATAQGFAQNAMYLGQPGLAEGGYNFLMSGPQSQMWKRQRMLNADPMMMATMAAEGKNLSQFAGPTTIQGRTLNTNALAMTDLTSDGILTGMAWGSTSLRLGNISAAQMGKKLFGGMDSEAVRAAVGGQKLYSPITLQSGRVVTSVGGQMGLKQYGDQLDYDFQKSQLGLQKKGLDKDYAYQMAVWGIQDRQRALGHRHQMAMFGFQEQSMGLQSRSIEMNNRFTLQNFGIQQQQMNMQRGWTREDWGFNAQTRAMQWGWQQEDFQENRRFMTGRDRRLAERQNERATIMHDREGDQIERQKKRQEELWKLEDARFAIQKQQHTEQHKLSLENLELQRKQFDENKKYYLASKKLEDELIALQRKHWLENHKLSAEQIRLTEQHAKKTLELKKAADQLEIALSLTKAEMNTFAEDALVKFQQSLVQARSALFAAPSTSASSASSYFTNSIAPMMPSAKTTTTTPVPTKDPRAAKPTTNQNNWQQYFNLSNIVVSTYGRAGGGETTTSFNQVLKTGEEGWEYLVGNEVIPHAMSVEMEKQGIMPGDPAGRAKDFMARMRAQDDSSFSMDSIVPKVIEPAQRPMKSESKPIHVHVHVGNQELKSFIVNAVGDEF